ncbi:MAG: DUF4426 domain-containing protein [Gammaproteobacteria bacterium]|nr:DUF4426 domain-containing protein [Gammaproteobacteria bacterium]
MKQQAISNSVFLSSNQKAIWTYRWLFLALAMISLGINAETKTSHNSGNHTVHYSVFNSTMIQPEVARAHGLKRAGNLAYINIAVVENNGNNGSNEGNYGIAASISGQARNLLQQQQLLRFIAIKEQNATYYLAPLYYNNEDIYHFDITAVVDKKTPAITFTFTKTLYVE